MAQAYEEFNLVFTTFRFNNNWRGFVYDVDRVSSVMARNLRSRKKVIAQIRWCSRSKTRTKLYGLVHRVWENIRQIFTLATAEERRMGEGKIKLYVLFFLYLYFLRFYFLSLSGRCRKLISFNLSSFVPIFDISIFSHRVCVSTECLFFLFFILLVYRQKKWQNRMLKIFFFQLSMLLTFPKYGEIFPVCALNSIR